MKTATIREDLLAITKDHMQAIVLNYFIEQHNKTNQEWIKIKATELITESMLTIKRACMQNILNKLCYDKKFLNKKRSGHKVFEYKVNFDKINKELEKKGY